MHNLATINGRTAMAYQGETPWHGLGESFESLRSVEAALKGGNLDWEVELRDMYFRDGDGSFRKSDFRRSVLRTGEGNGVELGSVGMQYHTIQNSEAFEILTPAINEFGITIESAGALGNGERAWMLAKMPESFEPVPGDTINGYFLVVNGHDGTCGHHSLPTPIRVVCQNTLNAATGLGTGKRVQNAMITIRHTKSADARLKVASEMIAKLVGAMKATNENFRKLAERRMTAKEVVAYVESVFPNPKPEEPIGDTLKARRATVARLVWEGTGAALAGSDANGSTAWAAYNAVTEYFDHVRPAEAKSAKGRQAANESAIFGANADLKLTALAKAMQLVKVAA